MLALAALWICTGASGAAFAQGPGAAEGPLLQSLSHRVGEMATLSLKGLPTSNISNLRWTTTSRGLSHIVALWKPGEGLSVLGESYTGRVAFLAESWALEIHNLSKADGGSYNVLELQEAGEVVLRTYHLFVFNIIASARPWANGTCSLGLQCEVGAGAHTTVEYSWKPSQPGGGPGVPGPALPLLLHPADKDKSYTCTARALGTEGSSSIVPYESCTSGSWAAGFPESGWLASSPARALLGPALLLVALRLL